MTILWICCRRRGQPRCEIPLSTLLMTILGICYRRRGQSRCETPLSTLLMTILWICCRRRGQSRCEIPLSTLLMTILGICYRRRGQSRCETPLGTLLMTILWICFRRRSHCQTVALHHSVTDDLRSIKWDMIYIIRMKKLFFFILVDTIAAKIRIGVSTEITMCLFLVDYNLPISAILTGQRLAQERHERYLSCRKH